MGVRALRSNSEDDGLERDAIELEEQFWLESERVKRRAAKNRELKAKKRAAAAAMKFKKRQLAEKELEAARVPNATGEEKFLEHRGDAIIVAGSVEDTVMVVDAPFKPTQPSFYLLVSDVKSYTVHRCLPSSRINVFVSSDVTLLGLFWAMNLVRSKKEENKILNFRGYFVEGEENKAVEGDAIGAVEGDGGSARDLSEYYLRVSYIGLKMCLGVVTTAAVCRGINKIASFFTTWENYVKSLHFTTEEFFGLCLLAPRTYEMHSEISIFVC